MFLNKLPSFPHFAPLPPRNSELILKFYYTTPIWAHFSFISQNFVLISFTQQTLQKKNVGGHFQPPLPRCQKSLIDHNF